MLANRVLPGGRFAPLQRRVRCRAGAGYCPRFGRTPDAPGWPRLPQPGRTPLRSSRKRSGPPDPRSPEWWRGRPGERRRFEPSNFLAINLRCRARMVSGLAMRATGSRPLRPKRLPIFARVARSPSESRQPGCRRVFKMRFSAARYSSCSRSSWLTNPVT